jgi:hypothetical protein
MSEKSIIKKSVIGNPLRLLPALLLWLVAVVSAVFVLAILAAAFLSVAAYLTAAVLAFLVRQAALSLWARVVRPPVSSF